MISKDDSGNGAENEVQVDNSFSMMLRIFKKEYYEYQRNETFASASEALADYENVGWRQGLRAHPLFDEVFYLQQNTDLRGGDVMSPLYHYAAHGSYEGRCPHPVFSFRRKKNNSPVASWASLHDYERLKINSRPKLSRFFSDEWYKKQLPNTDWQNEDPLMHYLTVGYQKGYSPFPSMDVNYYTTTWMSQAEKRRISPLEHFETHSEPRPRSFALFSPDFYRKTYADVLGCPITHFVDKGYAEARLFAPVKLNRYIMEKFPQKSFADRSPLSEHLRTNNLNCKRIVFIGHEGSRTGAPAILLKIIEQMNLIDEIECLSIVDQPGPLETAHERVSIKLEPSFNRRHLYSGKITEEEFFASLDEVISLFEENPPTAAVCNTAECRIYAKYFQDRGVPVISLMHEIASFFPVSELQQLEQSSDLLVFPSNFVARNMDRALPYKRKNAKVIPQGLLRETYGLLPRGRKSAVFAPYGSVRDDDIVVIGCGTLDGRKGFDLFVDVARHIKNSSPQQQIKFVWVGGRKDWRVDQGAPWDTALYWTHWDMIAEGLEQDIIIISEVPDTEQFLVNADIFLMSSRADPFPCVVHEAMAAQLPIVAFDNAGGTPEAILPDAGRVVPYRDTAAMAASVSELAADRSERIRLGQRGQEIVRSKYRFLDYTAKLVEEINHLTAMDFKVPVVRERISGRRRVFFTTPLWSVSGVHTMTEYLVKYLNLNGFEAEIVFTKGKYGPVQRSLRRYDVEKEYLPNVPFRFLQPASWNATDIRQEVQSFLTENAPCIFVPGFDYVASSVAESLPSTVGIVGVAHSDDAEHYSHVNKFSHFWNRIVAVSAEIEKNLLSINPSFAKKMKMVPYGLPQPAIDEREILSNKSNGGPIKIIYAGRFETFQKRIEDYARLAFALDKEGVDYELTLIGEGTKKSEITSILADQVAAKRVIITGRLSNDATLQRFLASDIVLVLSDFEGLPLSLIEGLNFACIPIVYDMKSGIPDLIINNENGFILEVGDINQVVAKIKLIKSNNELRHRIRRSALNTPKIKDLSLSSMGGGYATLFDEVFDEISNGDVSRRNLRQLVG